MITADLIRTLCPKLPEARCAEIASGLQTAATGAGITTPARTAAFVAQLAHESAGFRYLEELWGPTPAQSRYEGRADLGNGRPGDGYRYRGRGWIQLTGRHNYRKFGSLLGLDLEGQPDLAARPDVAARLAAAYWTDRGLNAYADAGDFREITRRINGGFNGLADRMRYHTLALRHLEIEMPSKVFIKDGGGKNIEWDGKPTMYGGIRLTRYPDGAVQLERVTPPAPAVQSIPATPPDAEPGIPSTTAQPL